MRPNVTAPKEPNPTIRYVVKRIRNSLGHARHHWTILPGISRNEILSKVTWSFHDVKGSDSSNTFDVTLTLGQLDKLVRKFHSVIHKQFHEKA